MSIASPPPERLDDLAADRPAKPLKIPKPQLYAGILIFSTVGAYGMRQSAFDLFLLFGIGCWAW